MFRWFREKRRDIKFSHGLAQAAQEQFDEGVINHAQLLTAQTASGDLKVIRELRAQLMTEPGMLGGPKDWDWGKIKKWIIEFLIPVLKAILPLLLADKRR